VSPLQLVFFQLFLLGFAHSFFSILQFFDMPNQDFFGFSLSLSSCPMWWAFHFGWFPYSAPCSYHIAIATRYIYHSRHKMSHIVHSTFRHTCSGTILCTLHHTAGPPVFWGQYPDTLHIYSSWMPQRPFRQVSLAKIYIIISLQYFWNLTFLFFLS